LNSVRENVRQVRLRFVEAPPSLPPIPGLLRAVRTGESIRLVCVRYDETVEETLRGLAPTEMEVSDVSLEDALISYLGQHGEKSFILSEMEEQP
jgi:ABC-2 type transport system ATP-binding protein